MRLPIVLMMRQPPAYVPSAMAVAAEITTQSGTWKSSAAIVPLATSASVITPIVFCASFVP